MSLEAEQVVEFVREALVVLDDGLRVVLANRPFCEKFQIVPDAIVGKDLFELGGGRWDVAELRALLASVVADGVSFEGFEVVHDFGRIGTRRILLNARRVPPRGARGGWSSWPSRT